MPGKGQLKVTPTSAARAKHADLSDFVLEKHIFSNIFERDIKRVFIYKKAERLAKAIHLIAPAFRETPSLRGRIDAIAVGLVDAAVLPPTSARDVLSRELLALSSVLAIARTTHMLSSMNADLIAHEAHALLQEVATYETPRVFLDETPSLAELSRAVPHTSAAPAQTPTQPRQTNPAPRSVPAPSDKRQSKGQSASNGQNSSRREAVLAVIREKGEAYIKDVSTVIRNVSEKTIQRELAALVAEGVLVKKGSRRWTSYTLA